MGRPKKSVCESCRYVMTASSESHCGYMLITGMIRGAHTKESCPKWEKRTRENYRGHFRLDPKMIQESRMRDMQAECRRSVQRFDEMTKGAKKNG